MIAAGGQRRGQPLVVLAVLLACWVGGRAVTWQSPFAVPVAALGSLGQAAAGVAAAGSLPLAAGGGASEGARAALSPAPAAWHRAILPKARSSPGIGARPAQGGGAEGAAPGAPGMPGSVMASHQLLWLAAMGSLPVPDDVAGMFGQNAAARPPWAGLERAEAGGPWVQEAGPARPDRWSFDSWLLLRPGAGGAQGTGAAPGSTYGGSQAGAVVRYRLDPGAPRGPAVYLRASRALAAGREGELAAGLAARPLPAVPLAIQPELRLARHADGRTEVRPAVVAVTALPPADLPAGLRGEAYAQAGYVGGTFATPFVDGQARIDRELARFDLGTVSAGAAAWGGAQEGAARLDLGPSARFDLAVGPVPARLAVDYRLRVAGDSAPGSGVAITLSAGF